jgi:hypothetical protein
MNDNFAVKEFVEPKTGKVQRTYTYKRRPCHRKLLESRLCSQIAGYCLIEKDLRSVLIWLQEIDRLNNEMHGGVEIPVGEGTHYSHGTDREKSNLVKGLFVAAITFYGKCFSQCDGRRVKLERTQLDERFRELHDECMSYRHNFAAHSGARKLEQVEIALVYPVKKNKGEFKVYKELNQPDSLWHFSEETSIVDLVEHGRSVANAKIELLYSKIIKEEVLPNFPQTGYRTRAKGFGEQ